MWDKRLCIKYVFTYSLMIKNHRKLEAINHCKVLLDFTCCFTPETYRHNPLARNCTDFNEANPDDLFCWLEKNLLSIKDHRNTDIHEPHSWSHACCKREIYGILTSVFGNASCLLSSSSQLIPFGLGSVPRTKECSDHGKRRTQTQSTEVQRNRQHCLCLGQK